MFPKERLLETSKHLLIAGISFYFCSHHCGHPSLFLLHFHFYKLSLALLLHSFPILTSFYYLWF
jgi:hypothetical protein